MLTLQQIEQQYPESSRPFKRGLLREYLQYKILEIIFASEYANKLSFLGGTALSIIHPALHISTFAQRSDRARKNAGADEPS